MKKTIRVIISCIAFVFLLLCIPQQPQAAVRNGLYKYNQSYVYYINGKKIKNCWRNVKGKQYYFTTSGTAARCGERNIKGKIYVFDNNSQLCKGTSKRIVKAGSNFYYVNPNGTVNKGWIVVNNNLYYADSRGRFIKNRTYQGITFTSSTRARLDNRALCKRECIKVLNRITNSSMSKETKLRKCYNYLAYGGFHYYLTGDPYVYNNGWWHEFAFDTLDNGGGNCYGFACAFAALANEIGYKAYLVCGRVPGSRDGASDGMTRHCWVQINGAFYDPEADFAGWARGIYGLGYYPMNYQVQRLVQFS